MGKAMTVYLTDEELKKMKDLCDNSGECPSRIVKIAIGELHVNADTLKTHRPLKHDHLVIRDGSRIIITGLEQKPKEKSKDIVGEAVEEVADMVTGEKEA